jgi:secondary thiamine-phosphate synthase enzyme
VEGKLRHELFVQTKNRQELVDLTAMINRVLEAWPAKEGLCTLFVAHTTAAITVNEAADPSVVDDLLRHLNRLVPEKGDYRHREGNSDAHIKAALIGNSVQIPVHNGRLDLGTWQGVFLAEFDGPRRRRVIVKLAADPD